MEYLFDPDPSRWRILVVDDEPDLVEVLCAALRYEGWQACAATTGPAAVVAAADWRPHAVVLDVMLPEFDGVEVLRQIHAVQPEVRVLFLSARGGLQDRIDALSAGADDYVTKPFSLVEVTARLRSLLRRATTPASSPAHTARALVLGDLVLDEQSHQVSRDGQVVELSPTEYALLRHLLQHPHQILSKAQILQTVWAYDFGGRAHVVELYISYLRKKIDRGRPPMIHTVRGAGYLIKAASHHPRPSFLGPAPL
ncbi:response regulator transcription factor [Streptomyces sp. H10-C2]|uniref:response regulator transcription factor n=1 Tax=unclassified Streptomyces TaxID=2593676 RepID=UPI0024BAE99C|nr:MULTISPECIES: response regulator transcription factor [unclassified Streptomyces]MDJ0344471.1 response regulator transcription factor [Streptomyces sp. PH10-H1]MDJ0372053.1 response regulator transcription factor [Streptomyces sp. H10-C2]